MTKMKKLLSIMLAIIMLAGTLSVSAIAAVDPATGLQYRVTSGTVVLYMEPATLSGEIVIPDTIAGYPVTAIAPPSVL